VGGEGLTVELSTFRDKRAGQTETYRVTVKDPNGRRSAPAQRS
jgi:hypothetical protein